ncbi:MAG: ribonuclease domain-containing protein [Eubacteriales bacterium]|nr:ribonuclease domain-containing protein [Eubacteriales bacterium]
MKKKKTLEEIKSGNIKKGIAFAVIAIAFVWMLLTGRTIPGMDINESTSPSQVETTVNATEATLPVDLPTGGGGSLSAETETKAQELTVKRGTAYTDKDHVALYIHNYSELPPNFVTKNEAKKNGWNSSENYLGDVMPGYSIGGDKFLNKEGKLPEGKKYFECDIDYAGKKRNAKRVVYSDDGWIYYTDDHYESFTLIYMGKPDEKY